MKKLSLIVLVSAVILSIGCKRGPPVIGVPSGPTSRRAGAMLVYSSYAIDPAGDSVAIRFDWGDGDTSDWLAWVQSSAHAVDSHCWSAAGTYSVRAQARNLAGALSDWSQPLPVAVVLTWARAFGGPGNDLGSSVQQTSDEGYIIAGCSGSFGGLDVYLIKLDAYGDTLWTRIYGGTYHEEGCSVQQTSDGGYVIAGYTASFGAGDHDVYLIKTDASGDTLWTKTHGGTDYDRGCSVQQTLDGSYIIAGYTYSFGAGDYEVYLVKTDASGDTLWTRTYGGTSAYCSEVRQTADGGYIIACMSKFVVSNDVRLIKTNASGDALWTRTYGGTDSDFGNSVQQTSDGGYIIAGWTDSFGAGSDDVYLIKTDASGATLWTRTYGGTGDDWGYSVQQTPDGGYVIAGWTESFGAGISDVYLIRTNASGDTLWTKTYGGTSVDRGYSVQQTADGGYIVAGYTYSFGTGDNDVYLIKTDSQGDAELDALYEHACRQPR